MKVAYFIGALQRGGAEALLLDICSRNSSLPFKMICIYRKEGNLSDEYHRTDARLIHVAKRSNLLRYILDLRQVIMSEHVDIVHSYTPSNTLLLSVALRGTHIRVITTFHGHSFANDVWWKRKIVYACSQAIVCVSRYEKLFYEQKWHLPKNNKLVVVYNGINFAKLGSCHLPTKKDYCSPIVNLCMVGSFCSGRSQEVVIRAMALVDECVHCTFIGGVFPGEEYIMQTCQHLVESLHLSNRVHFMGVRSDVPDILHTMDGYVYSTVSDTFGISVLEAMACGLPVVVNDWIVMQEVCDNRVMYFRTGDIEDCARAIVELANRICQSPRVIDEQGKDNAQWVRGQYGIETHINQLYQLYQSL